MKASYLVGGVALPLPIMVGAGACKSPQATADWLQVLPVVSGSYTLKPKAGNSGKVIYPDLFEEFLQEGVAYNSLGLPNCGYLEAAAELGRVTTRSSSRSQANQLMKLCPGFVSFQIGVACRRLNKISVVQIWRTHGFFV